jgi:hypothetical protein
MSIVNKVNKVEIEYEEIEYEEIFILSGGKTGSKTLEESFKKLFAPVPGNIPYYPRITHMHRVKHNPRLLRSISEGKRRLIVNSYRLPFSRHVSPFFQNLKHHMNQSRRMDIRELIKKDSSQDYYSYNPVKDVKNKMDKMNKYMNQGYFFASNHSFLEDLPFPLPEFDKHAKFTFEKRIHGLSIDVLMLRYDALHEWESQIQTIFPSFVLVSHNVSSLKPYAGLYQYFLQNYTFPETARKQLWELEKARIEFYYTKEEIQVLMLGM